MSKPIIFNEPRMITRLGQHFMLGLDHIPFSVEANVGNCEERNLVHNRKGFIENDLKPMMEDQGVAVQYTTLFVRRGTCKVECGPLSMPFYRRVIRRRLAELCKLWDIHLEEMFTLANDGEFYVDITIDFRKGFTGVK